MEYRIKIKFQDNKKKIIDATVYNHKGEASPIVSDYYAGESFEDFTDRIKAELDKEFANRVVTEKVRMPNVVVSDEASIKGE